jgi:hypothetical protein
LWKCRMIQNQNQKLDTLWKCEVCDIAKMSNDPELKPELKLDTLWESV